MRVATILLVGWMALFFQGDGQAPQIQSIRQQDMKADLHFLAGDSMQGRLTDTGTNSLAADWIKSRFERMGLKPAGPGGSYFQPYHLMTGSIGEGNSLTATAGDGVQLRLREGQDFHPMDFSASAFVRGPVAFAGFGIADPRLSYDDYRGFGANLRGHIALVLDDEPGERDPESPFDGVVRAELSSSLKKALIAQEKGAVGVLFVRDVHNHSEEFNFEAASRNYWPAEPRRIGRYSLATWVQKVRIPAAQISPSLAEILVRGTGKSFEAISRSAETTGGIQPFALPGVQVEMTMSVNRHVIPDRNVVGLVEGSDPRLKEEYVVVCAHYDHNGSDDGGVYNGADDDGSGTIGVTEIAEAYMLAAEQGIRPRRSVLLAVWNSEERGLLGAWAYTENPLMPLDKAVAVLNMDMIGRNEEVTPGGGGRFRGLEIQTAESNANAVNIIGTTRSADLRAAVQKANQKIGLEMKFRYDNNTSNLMRRSDHWPFLQRGVPGLWFHTGLHPDYHTYNDTPERINYVKMEKVARLVYQMSWDLAQQETRPRMGSGTR